MCCYASVAGTNTLSTGTSTPPFAAASSSDSNASGSWVLILQ